MFFLDPLFFSQKIWAETETKKTHKNQSAFGAPKVLRGAATCSGEVNGVSRTVPTHTIHVPMTVFPWDERHIYRLIYHKFMPNIGKYTIHGASGGMAYDGLLPKI